MTHALSNTPNITYRILGFAQLLRTKGYPTNPSSINDALCVATIQTLHDPYLLKDGFKACFCKTPDQWKRFDKLFINYWTDQLRTIEEVPADKQSNPSATPTQTQKMFGFAGTSSEGELSASAQGSGDYSALSLADFRFVFNPHEKRLIDQYVDELAQRCRRRHVKKTRIANSGSRVAMAQSIKQSLRHQGVLFQLKYHAKQKKLPSFILLLDISQSMDVYARLFLRFTRKLLSVFESSHAFAFNIELIDLGKGFHTMEESDLERTINTASQSWIGGTKIAKSFATFNELHLNNLVKSHTTVLVFSDGYDTDSPEAVAEQVRIFSNRARRVIWVNPLLGRLAEDHQDPGMIPLKPYITHYLSSHNLPSLLQLQKVLLS